MHRVRGRGARLVAPLVLAAALPGCTGHSAPATAPAVATPTTSAVATTDAAAFARLAAAERQLTLERSYRFDAIETVAAAAPATTRVAGTVVRGVGVAYTLTVGRTRTQVVRVRTATYVRKVPGHWSRLRHKAAAADPTASLLALLRGINGATASSSGRIVAGTVSGAAARAAGIPTGTSPAQVGITIDADAHVTAVTVRTTTQAGDKAVAVTLVTTYSAFGRTRSLRPPV